MRLIQKRVLLSVDRWCRICVAYQLGASFLIGIQNHMAQVLDVLKLLLAKELNDLVDQFFFDPDEEDAVAHDTIRNFKFLKFFYRYNVRFVGFDRDKLL